MGAVCQAQGPQLQPEVTSTQDGNESSGLLPQQFHLHRPQSVTSAVDYEYFDVGIGQVQHMQTNTPLLFLLGGWSFDASPSCFSPPLRPLTWTDQWRHSQGTGVSHMVSTYSSALSFAVFDLTVSGVSVHIYFSQNRGLSRELNYSRSMIRELLSYCAIIRVPCLSHWKVHPSAIVCLSSHSWVSPAWVAISLVSSSPAGVLPGCCNIFRWHS